MSIEFTYPGSSTTLLDRFSAQFRAASISVIVGPSGTGKSTLLDLIGGLQDPDEGVIRFSGSTWHGVPLARCSWVLQNNALLAQRSALDNAALALIAAGETRSNARERASQALGVLGLADRQNAKVESLSGGEAQRVTVARSLLSDAPILLADEPTGQLDAKNSLLVFDALRAAADVGKTVIVATHDLEIAQRADAVVSLADRA